MRTQHIVLCYRVCCTELLNRYKKKCNEVSAQYVTCLGEMAVAGEVIMYLHTISDDMFHREVWLFPTYLRSKSKGSFKQCIHGKIIANDDTQYNWVLQSQDIEDSNALLTLLTSCVLRLGVFLLVHVNGSLQEKRE